MRMRNKVTVYPNREAAEKAYQKAIDAADNFDTGTSADIEDEGLEGWLERTHRKIANPHPIWREKLMARQSLRQQLDEANDYIQQLEDERAGALASLSAIYGIEIADADEDGDEDELDEDEFEDEI